MDQYDYTPEPEFSIETLNPTVTVNMVDTGLDDGDNSSNVTFEFSEAVSGFADTDLTVVGGTISAFTMVDADSYTATFTATDGFDGTGSVTVTNTLAETVTVSADATGDAE